MDNYNNSTANNFNHNYHRRDNNIEIRNEVGQQTQNTNFNILKNTNNTQNGETPNTEMYI